MPAREIDIKVNFDVKDKAINDLDSKIDKMVGKVTGKLGNAEAKINKTASSFSKITTGANKASSGLTKIQERINRITGVTRNAGNQITKTTSMFSVWGRATKTVSDAFSKLGNAGKKIASPFVSAFNKVSSKIKGTISNMKNFNTSIKNAVTSSKTFNNVSNVFNKAKSTISRLTAPLQRLPNLFRKAGTEGQNAGNKGKTGMGNLTSAIFKANAALDILKAGFQKIIQSIGTMIETTDTWVNTTARLELINDGSQTTEQLRTKILGAATNSRGDYTTMADTTAKLGLLAGENFSSNDELIQFSELMQKSFAVSGASASEQSAGMYQLTQAMAAGKLQGDEFRSIMENAPMLADAIAKYTGKSKGELKEMSSEGLITSDIIKNALFEAGDSINKKFKSMPKTFSSVWTDIKNEALFAFSDIMEGANDFLNSDVGESIVKKVKKAINTISKSIKKVFKWITNNGDKVKAVLAGIATLITTKLVASFVKLGISLATNPITWIAAIIVAVGAALYYAYQKCEPFRKAVDGVGKVIKAAFGDEEAFNTIKEQFPQLVPIVENFRKAIEGVKRAFEGIKTAFKALFGDENSFNTLKEQFPELVPIVNVLKDAFDGVGKAVKFLWDNLMWFVGWVEESGLIEFFETIGNAIKTSILDTLTKIHETYVTYIQPAIDNLIEGFTKIRDKFVELWNEYIKPILDEWAPKFQSLWEEHIQPFINGLVEGIGKIIECISQLWNEFLAPLINYIMETIVPIVAPIFQFLGDTVMTVIGTICDVLGGLWDVLVGVIEFITGVFTGDWEKAWQGISDIFSGIWNGLKGIAEGVINTIIGLINGCIGMVNNISVTVPDWVPKFGGKKFGFDIPKLGEVHFAEGTKGAYNTPETFIAGEEGPELITGAKNKRVYPADETADMLGQGGNVINITMNINGSDNPQQTAKTVRKELEDFFASFNRRNPRVREV